MSRFNLTPLLAISSEWYLSPRTLDGVTPLTPEVRRGPLERRVSRQSHKENEMFGILGDLTKAVVGVVVETPIAIAADVLTLGGSITDKDEPYTATALKGVMKNVENATKPD